jgi:hypothetical protein
MRRLRLCDLIEPAPGANSYALFPESILGAVLYTARSVHSCSDGSSMPINPPHRSRTVAPLRASTMSPGHYVSNPRLGIAA